MRCSASTNARRALPRSGCSVMWTASISMPTRDTREKVDDQPGDLRSRILLREMPAGDQMRSLGMRQHLLEPAGKGCVVEHVVLAPPDDRGGQAAGGEFPL